MAIVVNLDVMMAKRKISLGELAERIDLTPANLSILKTGKGTRELVATLPVKRNNRIIFEIINTCVIVIGSYAVFLINMATVWAKIINFKAIENLNLNL